MRLILELIDYHHHKRILIITKNFIMKLYIIAAIKWPMYLEIKKKHYNNKDNILENLKIKIM